MPVFSGLLGQLAADSTTVRALRSLGGSPSLMSCESLLNIVDMIGNCAVSGAAWQW